MGLVSEQNQMITLSLSFNENLVTFYIFFLLFRLLSEPMYEVLGISVIIIWLFCCLVYGACTPPSTAFQYIDLTPRWIVEITDLIIFLCPHWFRLILGFAPVSLDSLVILFPSFVTIVPRAVWYNAYILMFRGWCFSLYIMHPSLPQYDDVRPLVLCIISHFGKCRFSEEIKATCKIFGWPCCFT